MKVKTLPPINGATSSKGGLSFIRKAARARSRATLATAKKLMKMARANGQTVTGVTICPDGAVTVTTIEGAKSSAVQANPWDAEFA